MDHCLYFCLFFFGHCIVYPSSVYSFWLPISIFKLFYYQTIHHYEWHWMKNPVRRVWRYQRVNQNPQIEEGQTTQWPKEKRQRTNSNLQNITHKTKDRVTRTPLKTVCKFGCSGRISSSCSTSGTRRVTLVTNLVISHERGKDRKVFTKSGTYPWSFVTQMFRSD